MTETPDWMKQQVQAHESAINGDHRAPGLAGRLTAAEGRINSCEQDINALKAFRRYAIRTVIGTVLSAMVALTGAIASWALGFIGG